MKGNHKIIYQVSTDDGMGGERNMGFAAGNESDIKTYYEPYKPYKEADIYLRKIEVNIVTGEMAENIQILNQEKIRLESRLKQINDELK
ncbi:hypothetical protein [Chryseobacterium aureum]|uniref:hypothetical protein n=1 Tax=Chryseobacterium aureum TaxID=2497456 RepID=UPI000F86A807|nr:hypothetical protein [Chryseobacterium aureum]